MGNNDTRPIKFRQSINDFPLTVTLGGKIPSWGLSRWGGNSGLGFIPPDDERFTLRGDKRRLLYKGRRRSHRFTILGDGAFEYDIVLLREPGSNVISLLMYGAECFDFFRQPDFVSDPFLRGSYAVYKKETFVGEGTGKLCHLHRPEIIDARSRRCWGELSIVGNELRITIPANWLSEAKYPVVVDPTVGTTSVGTQWQWEREEGEGYEDLYIEGAIATNRFSVSQELHGYCRGYAYTNDDYYGECGGRAVIYSESGNKPSSKFTSDEEFIDFEIGGSHGPKGWRYAPFYLHGTFFNGAYLWYGISADFFWMPRFDYGANCCIGDWYDLSPPTPTPNTFPKWSYFENLRLSMYFVTTGGIKNVITMKQGVTLTDNRKLSRAIKRIATQVIGATALLGRVKTYYRKCIGAVSSVTGILCYTSFTRKLSEGVQVFIEKWEKQQLTRKCVDGAIVVTDMKRTQSLLRKAQEMVHGFDSQEFHVLFYRSIKETTAVTHISRLRGEYCRELKSNAESMDELGRIGEYDRRLTEMVKANEDILRKLSIFIRIVTTALVRDYIIGRFLKAKSELVIKSCITREITLESKLT